MLCTLSCKCWRYHITSCATLVHLRWSTALSLCTILNACRLQLQICNLNSYILFRSYLNITTLTCMPKSCTAHLHSINCCAVHQNSCYIADCISTRCHLIMEGTGQTKQLVWSVILLSSSRLTLSFHTVILAGMAWSWSWKLCSIATLCSCRRTVL